jgi:replicative DNA helicase
MSSDQQTLPQNLEAERAILGAVILDNERLADAVEVIGANDFFRAGHRKIFERMVTLAARQQAVDAITLREELTTAGLIEEVGGASYLYALTDGVARGLNVKHYAAIVKQKAQLRTLIYAANKMLAQAYDATEEPEEILGAAERAILGLTDRTVSKGFESMQAIASRGLDELERRAASRQEVFGVTSGFPDLDDVTRGFQPGKLVTVAARPGVGKSSFLHNVLQNAALAGYCCGAFSIEMESDELFIRHVASRAQIDGHRLGGGFIGEREWGRVAHAISELSGAPLFIDESAGVSMFEVRARARRLKAEHGLRILAVDYLQLMSAHEKHHNRTLEIGSITGDLKKLAKELKVTILLLSQLSREVEKRGGRPKLSDLRDSGSIEQDSDIVMFLWRPDTPDPNEDENMTELIIAKHRGGPVGTVKLSWHERETRFDQYSRQALPQPQSLPEVR